MQREREVAWVFELKNPTRTATRVIPRSLAADKKRVRMANFFLKINSVAFKNRSFSLFTLSFILNWIWTAVLQRQKQLRQQMDHRARHLAIISLFKSLRFKWWCRCCCPDVIGRINEMQFEAFGQNHISCHCRSSTRNHGNWTNSSSKESHKFKNHKIIIFQITKTLFKIRNS